MLRHHGKRREGEHHQQAGAKSEVQVNSGIRIKVMPGARRLQDGDDEVDAGQRRADAGDQERPDPVLRADIRAVLDAGIGWIAGPACRRKLADRQGDQHQEGASSREPQAHRVHEREGDVARTDLLRQDHVHQADQERHGHEEDHDRAVRAEHLVEVIGWQIALRVERHRLLAAAS